MDFYHIERPSRKGGKPIRWSPFAEVVLEYERPDETVSGELLGQTFNKHFFANRHVSPTAEFDWSCRVDRDTAGRDEVSNGCHVSAASLPELTDDEKEGCAAGWSGDWSEVEMRGGELDSADDSRTSHQRDWDFLAETLEQAYSRAGVDHKSSIMDRVYALETFASIHRGRVHFSRHPVDVALYSSYCVGVANLFVALCHVGGINARAISGATHTLAEIWDGSSWILVDNMGMETRDDLFGELGGRDFHTVFTEDNYCSFLLTSPSRSLSYLPDRYLYGSTFNRHITEPYASVSSLFWWFNHCGAGYSLLKSAVETDVGFHVSSAPETAHAVYPG